MHADRRSGTECTRHSDTVTRMPPARGRECAYPTENMPTTAYVYSFNGHHLKMSKWLTLDEMAWVHLSLTQTRMVLFKNHTYLLNCFKHQILLQTLQFWTHTFFSDSTSLAPSHCLNSPQRRGYRSTTCMLSRPKVWRHSCCQCCSSCRKTGPKASELIESPATEGVRLKSLPGKMGKDNKNSHGVGATDGFDFVVV